jgi:hypothetical protein
MKCNLEFCGWGTSSQYHEKPVLATPVCDFHKGTEIKARIILSREMKNEIKNARYKFGAFPLFYIKWQ